MRDLITLMRRLTVALGVSNPDTTMAAISNALSAGELEDVGRSSPWLLDLLDALAGQRPTGGWVPFEVQGLEHSDAIDLLRDLERLLPVEVEDLGERITVSAPSIGLEAIVAFEGYLYLVKSIQEPEPI